MRELTWKELLKLKWGAYLALLLLFVAALSVNIFFVVKGDADSIWLGVVLILVALAFFRELIIDDKRKFRKCSCGMVFHSTCAIKCPDCKEVSHK